MNKGDRNYLTSMEFTNALNKYIPSLVLSQWISKLQEPAISLPELQSTETVVLFADISGFTNISEACALMGVRGNEELAFCINRYMEGMVKALGKYGGDIIKFVGDAMIVMWPRTQQASSSGASDTSPKEKTVAFKDQQVDDRVTVVRKAIQCAIDIQTELNNKKIMSNVTNLSVKIGIGFGQCALLYVGGVFNRSEFFTVGDALTQALHSEENATAGGQIIVSSHAWALVSEFFTSEELENHGEKFYRIHGLLKGIRTRADAVLLRNLIQPDNFSKIQLKLRSCIPAAIMPYLEIGYEAFGSETRRLTVMFASLGVDLSSAQTQEGMKRIQKIVTTVQQQVYRLEGSLNKLVMDDKGSTLICIWGLCPFAHEDDAARAILTAINMRRELAKIDNTWCNVGISTGEVFSGVVGTSGSRKEFSVLGDFVNLAARIMYYPKKYGLKGKINVDLQTKKEADNYVKFNYKGHCEFKGKSVSLPIFEPVDPQEEAEQCLKKIVGFDTFLKIHSNPFLVDRNSDFKKKNTKQIGRETLLHRVYDDLVDYFDADSRQVRPFFLVVSGEIGSGKTLFGRCLFDSLKRKKDFLRDDQLGPEFKAILTSSLNAESQMWFLNAWRPVLQMMMVLVTKRTGQSPLKVIQKLMNSAHDDRFFDLILEIFNLAELKTSGPLQLPEPRDNDGNLFVKRQRFPEELEEDVLEFVVDFVKEALGEKEDCSSDSDDDRSSRPGSSGGTTHPMLLVFDAVFLMDEASWKLLELVKDECGQVAVVLLMQTDTNNQLKILPEAREFYQGFFGNHPELFQVVDLPPFKVEDLNQLVAELAAKYQASMQEEIQLMTLIEDPATSIKNAEVCKQKEKELRKKMMVHETFQLINDEVLQVALQRCEGNPLVCLNFLFNLLTNDFLTVKDQCLLPTSLFKKCKQRQDWSLVPVPGINQKINCSLIDGFIKEMRSKQNKVDSETAVKGALLLKSAAVIGEVFSSRVLQHITPLRNETHKSIMQVLRILENKDFIEILDETDHKNVVCRFRKIFLRETIYQIMLYRAQKKGLHQLMVQYIQNHPNALDNDPEQEADKLLGHILIAEDLDSEDKIPSKSRQGLIVKKIANKLLKNPNTIVKSGYLTKMGDKPNKKVEKRLMILTSKEVSWYHNEKEFKANKPLGVIYMAAIYHCVPANTAKRTEDLIIGTCAWRKKNAEKEGKREFIFGAKDETERDEWITYIEYLRVKATYDTFTQKFCSIALPIRRQSEEIEVEMRKDFLNNMNEFGLKFKTSARVAKGTHEEQPSMARNQSRNSVRYSRIQNKIGSFAAYNLTQMNESLGALANPKDLAAKLKKLYNISMVNFVNQVGHNSNKHPSTKSDSLKKLPEVLRNSSLVQNNEDPDQHHTSMVMKQSMVVGNNSILNQSQQNSSSPMIKPDKFFNYKDSRRISDIPHKRILEDTHVEKHIIEEIKSADKKSAGAYKNSDQIKITEENEDDLSDGSYQNSSVPQRKSAYSDNMMVGSPNQGGMLASQNFTSDSHGVKSQNELLKQSEQEALEVVVKSQEDHQRKKQSRISKQFDMIQGLSKQREMTFHQNAADEMQAADTQQFFALNLKQTQEGKTPKKSITQFNPVEEDLKKGRKKEREASSSSDSGRELVKKETKVILDKEDTGDFSQDNSKIDPIPIQQNQSLLQSSKASIQQHLSAFPERNSIKQQKSVNNPQPLLSQQQVSKDLSFPIEQILPAQQTQIPQVSNITELISQAIQEQVSKSFQQLMQSVQKISVQQHPQFSPLYQSLSPQPIHSINKRDSSISKSFTSSIYDEEWRSQVHYRQQLQGGATSSKKIKMEKAMSKGMSPHQKKPSQQLSKGQREETEVDDENEEEGNSSSYLQEFQREPQLRAGQSTFRDLQQQAKEIGSTQNIEQRRPKSSIDQVQIERRQDQRQGFNDMQRLQTQNYPIIPTNKTGSYKHSSSSGYQPSPLSYHESPHQYHPAQVMQSPPYPIMAYPYQHQYTDYPQMPYNQYLNRNHIDNELFFIEDNFDTSPTTFTQNQYISDISSIIAGDILEPQNQQAIVLEDCQCQIKGEMMQLYEGDKVEIVRILNDIQIAEVKYSNKIGVIPLKCLKMIKRNTNASVAQLANAMNLKKSKDLMSKEKSRNTLEQIGKAKTETYGMSAESKSESKRQNFFKAFPHEQPPNDQTQSQKSMLKLHARKNQRQNK